MMDEKAEGRSVEELTRQVCLLMGSSTKPELQAALSSILVDKLSIFPLVKELLEKLLKHTARSVGLALEEQKASEETPLEEFVYEIIETYLTTLATGLLIETAYLPARQLGRLAVPSAQEAQQNRIESTSILVEQGRLFIPGFGRVSICRACDALFVGMSDECGRCSPKCKGPQ